jgi:hypothetical protein
MTSHTFGAFIDIELSSDNREEHTIPIVPQKAVPRSYHSVPDPIELDNLEWGKKLNGPSTPGSVPASGYQTPQTTDLEMSRPPSPTNEELGGVAAMQSFSNPPMNRFRMLSVCLMNFGNGLSDSAPGALIPYIEKYIPSLLSVQQRSDLTLGIIKSAMPSCLSFSLPTLLVSSQPPFALMLSEPVLVELELLW